VELAAEHVVRGDRRAEFDAVLAGERDVLGRDGSGK
jgi:hypothetical protein